MHRSIAALLLVVQSTSAMVTGSVLRLGADRAVPGLLHLNQASTPLAGAERAGAGMGKQLDALLRAATGGRIRRRPRLTEGKNPGPVSVEFLSPCLLVNYLVQKHLALLLELSSGLHRLNFLPLAGTALLYVKRGPQMMLVRSAFRISPSLLPHLTPQHVLSVVHLTPISQQAGAYAGIGVAAKNIRAVGRQRGAGERFLEHMTADEKKVHLV